MSHVIYMVEANERASECSLNYICIAVSLAQYTNKAFMDTVNCHYNLWLISVAEIFEVRKYPHRFYLDEIQLNIFNGAFDGTTH